MHPMQEEQPVDHVALQAGALQLRTKPTRGPTVGPGGAEHSRGRSSKFGVGMLARCARGLRLTVAAWQAGAQLLNRTQKRRPAVAVDGGAQRSNGHGRNKASTTWFRRNRPLQSGVAIREAGAPDHINRTRLETMQK